MSLLSYAKVLLFLVNVKRVEEQASPCNWVCDGIEKITIGKTAAKFKFSNRVDRHNCEGTDTAVKSWDFITTRIIEARDVDNLTEVNFLTFGIEVLSEHLTSFLFQNQYEELQSVNNSVSCVLQPAKSNLSRRVTSDGLDPLYSPMYYFRDSGRNSYVGYVEMGGTFHISARFTKNAKKLQYRVTLDQSVLTRLKMFSIIFSVLFPLFYPFLLTLFCATINTLQIERLSRAIEIEEEKKVETRKNAVEQEESRESDCDLLSAAGNGDAGKEFPPPRQSGQLKKTHSDHLLVPETNDDLELGSFTAEHPLGISARFAKQENNSSNGHFEIPAKKNPATVPEFHQTRSGGTSVNRASWSSSTMDKIEPNRTQSGVQHQNIKNKTLNNVQVMDVGAQASPVGLRSLIANKVFSNSKSLSWHYQLVKFVILIMFPLFIPFLIDVFVLVIPILLPRIAHKLPSPFLIKSVFNFTHEVSPAFRYFCSICYIFRIFCFCFLQSSSNWVSSFLGRKHLVCFIHNHYLSQLSYASNSWSACDECKEAPDLPKHCEIPVNIKCNFGFGLLEIFKKNWKDVSQNIHPKYICGLFLGSEDEISFQSIRKLVCLIPSGILFTLLVIMDTIASLPIISLIYGRVWFTTNWFQSRYTQAVCLVFEFLVICFSVVCIAYVLFCCSLSIVLALSILCITAVNHTLEIIYYLAINIMVWHTIWRCYSSFTNVYDDLLLKLFEACRKDHESELNQYKEGNVQYIPQELFTSACNKLKPVKNSVYKLLFHLSIWAVGLFVLLPLIFTIGSSTEIYKVLGATVTFLVVVNPSVWDFLVTRGKKEERKHVVLKKAVEDHVDAFFKNRVK